MERFVDPIPSLKLVSLDAIPNNQYQATASQVFVDCCEKCMEKCDKNSVVTINIYTNVKFKILVFMRVENVVL